MEIRLERGGREIWLSATAASLRDPREELPGTVFAIRDVSDERRLDQVKSDFVATVSHELRTPLTSIYGFAETLLRADTTFGEDDRATFVRYIATEAERLTRLVDGLLSATRLEAGAVQLALGPVDVPGLAREVATAARGRSDRHRVKLVVPAQPVYALADQDRVRQVLINLVDNAIKYSPSGGEVKVQARGRGKLVEVRVSDQGIGISELDQRNLFRKFFRVDASQRGGIRGVGLGLFLVRGFVAAMGGRIWVESELGKGSTFVVELPACEEAPSATRELRACRIAGRAAAHPGGRRRAGHPPALSRQPEGGRDERRRGVGQRVGDAGGEGAAADAVRARRDAARRRRLRGRGASCAPSRGSRPSRSCC